MKCNLYLFIFSFFHILRAGIPLPENMPSTQSIDIYGEFDCVKRTRKRRRKRRRGKRRRRGEEASLLNRQEIIGILLDLNLGDRNL